MNIDAINKIDDAQALLSILAELSTIDCMNNHERLNYGAFLITQLIDKTLIESKELLIDFD
jgi:hypothetical protein